MSWSFHRCSISSLIIFLWVLLLGSRASLSRFRRLCFREKVTPLASFSPAPFPRCTIFLFDGGSVSLVSLVSWLVTRLDFVVDGLMWRMRSRFVRLMLSDDLKSRDERVWRVSEGFQSSGWWLCFWMRSRLLVWRSPVIRSKGDEVVSLGKRLLPAWSGEAPFSFRRGPVKRRSVSGVIPFGGIGVGSCDACHASLWGFDMFVFRRDKAVANHRLLFGPFFDSFEVWTSVGPLSLVSFVWMFVFQPYR